jgi:hypothetical protein
VLGDFEKALVVSAALSERGINQVDELIDM